MPRPFNAPQPSDDDTPSPRHALQRPSWRCTCGEPWPCAGRRTQLLDEYSGHLAELRTLMGGFVADALGDGLGDARVEALRRQLTDWLPPRRLNQRPERYAELRHPGAAPQLD